MLDLSFKKIALGFGLLALIATLMVPANSSGKSFTPYYGKSYSQPDQVLEYYPEPDIDFETPAFTSDKERFTSQGEMMSFLRELTEESQLVDMEIIGRTTEGKEIPMLMFRKGEDHKEKANVWLQGQIHGDEPAAGETALVMAQKLAGEFGEDILEKINVNIVPRVNPDGAYYFTRETARNLDANRDHFKLVTPEINSIHKAFHEFQPDVSVVGHEYGTKYTSQLFKSIGEEGALSHHDILLNPGLNLEVPQQIRDMSIDLFIANAENELTNRGFSNEKYYGTSGRNEEGQLIVEQLTNAVDRGPSNFAITPAFSFITETRGGQEIGRENFKRRVASSVTAQTSFLETTAENSTMIKNVVKEAKQTTIQKGRQVNDNNKVAIKSEKKSITNYDFSVTGIATGKPLDLKVEFLSAEEAIPTFERVRPVKYVLPPEYEEIVEKVQVNGAEVTKTEKPIKLEVESYTVTDKEVDENKFEGVYQSHVETEVTSKEIELPAGSYVFSMAQPIGNKLPLMFEPESDASYVTWNMIPSEVGNELPIYRVMKPKALSAEDIKLLVKGFETEESIDDRTSHSLQVHLSAVNQYEKKGKTEKIIKHMNGFKTLLDHQIDNDLISENAYSYLKTSADSLIEVWE
ncbi:M14 family metallopeptidase [Virgibacillus natechei]|uniref:M14 family metallopeptidase n=1 Tax=Virgibacillus sp. CBA3643 TaxID=2942278 RepID=UPI0035A2DC68